VAYTVRFTATAQRDLHKLPPQVLSALIEFASGDLAREPRRVGKPLRRELVGLYTARRGPYRVLYRIDEDRSLVAIERVDHQATFITAAEPAPLGTASRTQRHQFLQQSGYANYLGVQQDNEISILARRRRAGVGPHARNPPNPPPSNTQQDSPKPSDAWRGVRRKRYRPCGLYGRLNRSRLMKAMTARLRRGRRRLWPGGAGLVR
jgi:mRNA-degrading endonuclease RelE of RelBE toxin-antitoxin system